MKICSVLGLTAGKTAKNLIDNNKTLINAEIKQSCPIFIKHQIIRDQRQITDQIQKKKNSNYFNLGLYFISIIETFCLLVHHRIYTIQSMAFHQRELMMIVLGLRLKMQNLDNDDSYVERPHF